MDMEELRRQALLNDCAVMSKFCELSEYYGGEVSLNRVQLAEQLVAARDQLLAGLQIAVNECPICGRRGCSGAQ